MNHFHFTSVRQPDRYARIAARQAAAAARKVETDLEFSKCDIERLLMITEALWTILKEQHGLDDEELVRRIEDIDLQDGTLDGRVAPSERQKCSKCDITINKRHPFCIYCGEAVSADPFAR